MTVGGRVGALWIGGLEPYMDETFLQVTFIAFTFTNRAAAPTQRDGLRSNLEISQSCFSSPSCFTMKVLN